MCIAESKANEELIREAMRVGTSEQLSKSRKKREQKKKRNIFTALDFVRTFEQGDVERIRGVDDDEFVGAKDDEESRKDHLD